MSLPSTVISAACPIFILFIFSCGTCIVAYTDDISLIFASAEPWATICPIFKLFSLITPLIGALIIVFFKLSCKFSIFTFCASILALAVSMLARPELKSAWALFKVFSAVSKSFCDIASASKRAFCLS